MCWFSFYITLVNNIAQAINSCSLQKYLAVLPRPALMIALFPHGEPSTSTLHFQFLLIHSQSLSCVYERTAAFTTATLDQYPDSQDILSLQSLQP